MFCCMLLTHGLRQFDDGKFVGAIFLDLTKGFDCVDGISTCFIKASPYSIAVFPTKLINKFKYFNLYLS